MAPHLAPSELDRTFKMQGERKTPIQIHKWLVRTRKQKGIRAQDLTNVRKVLKGNTYKRGAVETRGPKRVLSKKQISKLNSVRKKLLKKEERRGGRERTQLLPDVF